MICNSCIFYQDDLNLSRVGIPVSVTRRCLCHAPHNVLLAAVSDTTHKEVIECTAYSESVDEWDNRDAGKAATKGWTFAEMMRAHGRE